MQELCAVIPGNLDRAYPILSAMATGEAGGRDEIRRGLDVATTLERLRDGQELRAFVPLCETLEWSEVFKRR